MDSEPNWMSDFGAEKCIVILTLVNVSMCQWFGLKNCDKTDLHQLYDPLSEMKPAKSDKLQ